MIQKSLFVLLIFGMMALLAGCSDTTTTSPADTSTSEDFGDYTPTDESAFFGDSYMMAEMGEDSTYDDPMVSDSSADSVINDPNSGVYAFRVIWGSLEYDSTIIDLTDWTGSLVLSSGAMLVRKLIRFEPGQDYILPRTSKDSINWVSFTTVHNDGIFVYLYVPPSVTADIKTLTFETGPLTQSFTISELAKLDTIINLDDSVNAVAFRAFKVTPHGHACPRGFLEGRWGRDSTGQGIFMGRWLSQHGLLAGHLRGEWGVVDVNGVELNVFYGKYIDIGGNFQGLLKGIYVPFPGYITNTCCPPLGRFYGFIYNANENVIGVLKGNYRMPPDDSARKMGYFGGRWKTYCDNWSHNSDAQEGMDGNF
jgi:hypothetical protein